MKKIERERGRGIKWEKETDRVKDRGLKWEKERERDSDLDNLIAIKNK